MSLIQSHSYRHTFRNTQIPTEQILDDFGINTTESVIVGTDRLEVLNRIQSAFAREFEQYGKTKNQTSTYGL